MAERAPTEPRYHYELRTDRGDGRHEAYPLASGDRRATEGMVTRLETERPGIQRAELWRYDTAAVWPAEPWSLVVVLRDEVSHV